MDNIKSYYALLGINKEADEATITQAIATMRLKSSNDSYQSLLNNIQQTLSDADKRKQYDQFLAAHNDEAALNVEDQLMAEQLHQFARHAIRHNDELTQNSLPNDAPAIQQQGFVDLGAEAFLSKAEIEYQKKREAGPATVVEVKRNALDATLFNPHWHQQIVKMLLLIFVASALAWVGYKAYVRWQTEQQADQASQALWQTTEIIEQFIRDNHYYPEQLPATAPKSSFYTMHLDHKNIVLTFTNQAAGFLPNTQLQMQAKHVKAIGLTWRCKPGHNFPPDHQPAHCY